ncbi:unnamed protein product [Triticum turgidum subsp. durum]|uniref:Protein kinase domain-containing protein n=1 Tax=Triticum turgidum subsp. durum TaxID=4567 RepID=A0A9R0RNS6_TRITD|nr:unnamed protein product [Triticum turgidum subsp. durum]
MDDEDYSWVRRTRFSHSVVRSNSGREQFGAFVEQFNRGAALRQNKGSDSGFKLHGMNFEPRTKASATTNAAPISRTRSLSAQPKTDLNHAFSNAMPVHHHEKPADHGRPPQSAPANNSANGTRGRNNLFVDVCSEPEVQEPGKGDSPGPLEFSFHPEEQSMRLQRVCSSPWTVDRKQLLIGQKFAYGAHSRLFHGIYKEVPVAVKFIRQPDVDEDAELASQLEKQFNTEVVTLSRLQHRNVIKLVGACTSPPVFCVITEFLSGGSLRSFLHKQEHKSLPLDKIISVGLDIAHGMGYVHSQGIVHRDVKPENIIFDGDCAKIVDFGIACEEAYCDPLANDPGTFRWMAPEMMKHKPYGRKVDVYSFGLILWEMLTGSVPYEDLTPFQAAFAVFDKNVRPAIPATCPAALRVLIEQCWALQADKRPEFWQIVQLLDKFKMVLERDGTLDNMPSSNCQENHDPKKWLAHWLHKLKHPHHHHDLSGPPPPKLL